MRKTFKQKKGETFKKHAKHMFWPHSLEGSVYIRNNKPYLFTQIHDATFTMISLNNGNRVCEGVLFDKFVEDKGASGQRTLRTLSSRMMGTFIYAGTFTEWLEDQKNGTV